MLFIKTIGILFLCSLAATDMITFKPFLKSRYSLRERRAKSTTRSPLIKSNDTVLNYVSTEVEIQDATTQALTHIPETTKAFTEKQIPDSTDQSTSSTLTTTPATTTTRAPELTTPSVVKVITSSPRGIVNLESAVTEKIMMGDTMTTRKIETTTQTEWVYDYYASDDENPRRQASS